MNAFETLRRSMADTIAVDRWGEIEKFTSLIMEVNGLAGSRIGDICDVLSSDDERIIMQAQIVGFAQSRVYAMPFGNPQDIRHGDRLRARPQGLQIAIASACIGRILDAFGKPVDEGPELISAHKVPLLAKPINPLQRQRIQNILETGIPCIDALLPIGRGQRMGIFAGSGVGKSTLLGRIARHIDSDVNVIALIGERGREVREFIEDTLGEEGLRKSLVIAACADEAPAIRRQAAYTATAIAEYFCSQGKDVVLIMDSITRLAMAQREIGLALGEPPTARAYTPSVFSLLPALVERAGNYKDQGSITAFYSVLVEGDDFNEPIADTMRSLLDGHIVLTRALAQSGHYPAIDILQSLSRLAPQLVNASEQPLMQEVIRMMHCYENSREMVDIGAYTPGSNPLLDAALQRIDRLRALFGQSGNQKHSRAALLQALQQIMENNNDK